MFMISHKAGRCGGCGGCGGNTILCDNEVKTIVIARLKSLCTAERN